MHKHRANSKSGSHRSWRNANGDLPESATNLIRNLLAEFGSESDFSLDYLRSEYLSKYLDEGIVTAEERRKGAIQKWLSTESNNALTNAALRERDPGYNIMPRVSYSSFLKFARRIIAEVLGALSDEVVLGSFSGGASTSRGRTESSPAHKFTGLVDTTADAGVFVDTIYREMPLLRQLGCFTLLREVEGAKLFTVPKKTEIDRCACKEPDVNMFLQKGVGAHIRRRLRRFGINLNDQSVNRRLASDGARDGTLATLDLSSASDTITIECVRALLPHDWFLYLNDIRSHNVVVEEKLIRTEMFSSMGNGFTFELESLIFWALTRTTLYFEGISGIVSVYGDDIICPSQGYDMVSWVLHSFGFEVNSKKSFATGPFRESCGGHYHLLDDVTPFYLKRPATKMTDVIRVANQLRRWALTDPARQYLLPTTYNVWCKLAAYVPRDLWGGYDLALDTQLVAPCAPTNRLIRLTSTRCDPEVGRYAHWHNSNWKRTTAGDISAEPNDSSNTCRKRAVRNGTPYCEAWFREELGDAFGPR